MNRYHYQRNEVVAKVMSLLVSVILSTGGSASVHAGILPPPKKETPREGGAPQEGDPQEGGTPPQKEASPQEGGTPPQETPQEGGTPLQAHTQGGN